MSSSCVLQPAGMGSASLWYCQCLCNPKDWTLARDLKDLALQSRKAAQEAPPVQLVLPEAC